MAFRSAAVLWLAVRLVLAEPGSLRGATGPNGTAAAIPDVEAGLALAEPGSSRGATGPNVTDNATPAALGAALGVAGGALPGASQDAQRRFADSASEAEAWLRGNLTLGATAQGDHVGNWYLDGECHPCPAKLYTHCSRGGRLMWSQPCGGGGMCQGMCTAPGSAPAGAQIPHIRASPAGIRTLYHETSPTAASSILATGFRPGNTGYCGGAIYFYGSPNVPSTKLGPSSNRGAVIEAKVDMGMMAHLDSTCDGADEVRRRYDSVVFNPTDGDEYVIFSKARVLSMRRYS